MSETPSKHRQEGRPTDMANCAVTSDIQPLTAVDRLIRRWLLQENLTFTRQRSGDQDPHSHTKAQLRRGMVPSAAGAVLIAADRSERNGERRQSEHADWPHRCPRRRERCRTGRTDLSARRSGKRGREPHAAWHICGCQCRDDVVLAGSTEDPTLTEDRFPRARRVSAAVQQRRSLRARPSPRWCRSPAAWRSPSNALSGGIPAKSPLRRPSREQALLVAAARRL